MTTIGYLVLDTQKFVNTRKESLETRSEAGVSNIFLSVLKHVKSQKTTVKVIVYCFKTWLSTAWSAEF